MGDAFFGHFGSFEARNLLKTSTEDKCHNIWPNQPDQEKMHFTNFCVPVYSIYPLATILKKSVHLKYKQRTKAGSNMAARPGLVESESWSVQPAESACAGSSNTDHFLPGSTSEQ